MALESAKALAKSLPPAERATSIHPKEPETSPALAGVGAPEKVPS